MTKAKVPPQVFIYGVATLIIGVILYLLLKRIGLIKSKIVRAGQKTLDQAKAEKKTDKAELKTIEKTVLTSNIFDPNTYKKVANPRLLTAASAEKSAKFLHDAMKGADDEEAIYGLFKKLSAPEQVSQIADAYFRLFKEDLASRLNKDLTNKEMQVVWQIINAI